MARTTSCLKQLQRPKDIILASVTTLNPQMNQQIHAACMRQNKNAHDTEAKHQLCTQMLKAWCLAKLLYVNVPQTKAPAAFKQGAFAAEETSPLSAGRLTSRVQVQAQTVTRSRARASLQGPWGQTEHGGQV